MASCLYRVKCVSESGFWNWIIWQSDVWDHLRVKCGHFLKGFKLAIAEEWDFHWLFMLLFWRTSEAKKTKQNKKKLQKQTWMCLPQNFSFSYFSVWIPRIKSSKFHKKTFPLAFMLFSSSALFFVLFCFVCGLYRSSLSYIGPRSSLSVHNTVWNKMFQLPFLSINAPDWLPLSNKIHEQQLWS